MADTQVAPVFANRYRFEQVDNDWDVGRSGYTHLVYDLKKNRYAVIKRAEVNTKHATDLENEIEALKALKGRAVPDIYETGQATYGSKTYLYVAIEYINAIRLERHLITLSIKERAEILIQFFSLLAEAHQKGIVNGDIDIKHLFWNSESHKLTVIDWGNAKLNLDPKRLEEFSYDLARSAEIIYLFVTANEHLPTTGPLTLPSINALIPGLSALPKEYLELCQWAPRNPIVGIKAPFTALQMLAVTQQWHDAISGNRHKNAHSSRTKLVGIWMLTVIIFFIGGLSYFFLSPTTMSVIITQTSISTKEISLKQTASPTSFAPTSTNVPTISMSQTVTSTPVIMPRNYEPIFVFDDETLFQDGSLCWQNMSELTLKAEEGFFRRRDDKYWEFRIIEDDSTVIEERPIDKPLYVGFSQCFTHNKIQGLGLNTWVIKMAPERDNPNNPPGMYNPSREFGIFIENKDGVRREYTFWIDKSNTLHLLVRERGIVIYDKSDLSISPTQYSEYSHLPYSEFSIQIFLEINNNGNDVLYLLRGSDKVIKPEILSPQGMVLTITFPSISNLQNIGLVGYGGDTQVIIWPMVFFE